MDNTQLFDQFVTEYTEWCETGKKPSICDQDSAFLLEIQKERLAKKAVHMRCGIKRYKSNPIALSSKGTKYNAYRVFGDIERDLEFFREGRAQLHIKNDQTMAQVVITDEQAETLLDRAYVCPNCGASSNVRKLIAGCSYCGTRFLMKDLFPIVNNFWFIRNDSSETLDKREKEMMHGARILCFLGCFIYFLLCFKAKLVPTFFASLVAAFVLGWPVGKIAYMFTTIFISTKGNGESYISPKAWKTNKRITEFLSRYDPQFQYYYFEGQVLALLRMCMISEHPEDLCCFGAGKRQKYFDDVLDCMYCGHMILKGAEVKDGMCRLDLMGYFLVVIDQNGKIISKGQKIEFAIERAVSAVSDQTFSIHAVNCPSCGGSFDAAHRRICPFCSSEYELKEKDWVIVKMDMI